MRRFPAAPLFLAILVLGFAFPTAAASKSLEAEVRARQQTALALAGKGRWNAAFQTLAAARDQINAERHKSTQARPPLPPALRAEAKALNGWLASKRKERKPGEPLPPAVLQEYRRRQTALRQKIAKVTASRQSAPNARLASQRFGFLHADVDDTAAAVHQRKGDAAEATDMRLQAGRRRLKLYSEAGKSAEANATASKLAKTGAKHPVTLAAVAEYHQNAKRFGPATQFWRQAIRLREKQATSTASAETQLYYRQLAYCYDRLGKAPERDAARAAAARLEAARAPRSRPQ